MEKVEKSNAEWRERLTPEQYDVCRRKGTERAFSGVTTIARTRGLIIVSVVIIPCFLPMQNLIPVRAGPVFLHPFPSVRFWKKKIVVFSCAVRKRSAPDAMRILATSFQMAPSRQACAIA